MSLNTMSRKAKIICTLGPASSSVERIRALAMAGMNVARINFSHGNQKQHRQLINNVRCVAEEMNQPIGVLQDLQGPKIRVGHFEEGPVSLKKNDAFILTSRHVAGTRAMASVSYDDFHRDVTPGDRILLDDGNIQLCVESVNHRDVHCRVVFGGILSDHKGVNLPDAVLSLDCLTTKDLSDLEFGMKEEVDFVALSFVQRPEDIVDLKKQMERLGRIVPIVAKIEKPRAVERIEEIIELTDLIMIARGDLGVEMPPETVPYHQKEIIKMCNRRGVPVITATQMLESMITHPRPTRAEASDVANAVLDGSDAVMLSGETAVGRFPVEAVRTMAKIIATMEANRNDSAHVRRRRSTMSFSPGVALGFSASQAAEMLHSSAIICLTQSGTTAKTIARFRPETPILALTNSKLTLNQMALYWGVYPVSIHELSGNMDEIIHKLMDRFRQEKRFSNNDTLIFTAGLPFHEKRSTNMLRIETVT
jgi:pyruvate kinase